MRAMRNLFAASLLLAFGASCLALKSPLVVELEMDTNVREMLQKDLQAYLDVRSAEVAGAEECSVPMQMPEAIADLKADGVVVETVTGLLDVAPGSAGVSNEDPLSSRQRAELDGLNENRRQIYEQIAGQVNLRRSKLGLGPIDWQDVGRAAHERRHWEERKEKRYDDAYVAKAGECYLEYLGETGVAKPDDRPEDSAHASGRVLRELADGENGTRALVEKGFLLEWLDGVISVNHNQTDVALWEDTLAACEKLVDKARELNPGFENSKDTPLAPNATYHCQACRLADYINECRFEVYETIRKDRFPDRENLTKDDVGKMVAQYLRRTEQ